MRKKHHQANTAEFAARGIVYGNGAAGFWLSLLEEIRRDYPACDAVLLRVATDQDLSRDLLYPLLSLQQELDRQAESRSTRSEIRALLHELEICGPPAAIKICLLANGRTILRQDLPLDCVDAEIFLYLTVWLLEWGEVPDCQWNEPELTGDCWICENRIRRHICFRLQKNELAEGLFQRELLLFWVG